MMEYRELTPTKMYVSKNRNKVGSPTKNGVFENREEIKNNVQKN
jgi:hypothetical protein